MDSTSSHLDRQLQEATITLSFIVFWLSQSRG